MIDFEKIFPNKTGNEILDIIRDVSIKQQSDNVPGEKIAKELPIPVIGIGAGNKVDGQVLVSHDMLGISQDFSPRFLRRYLNLFDEIKGAVETYIKDVKNSDFPNEKEQY